MQRMNGRGHCSAHRNMTNSNHASGDALSAACIAACEAQLAAYTEMFKGTAAQGDAAPGSALPPAFTHLWQSFARSLGIPLDLTAAPALPAIGLAREHLEIAQKITDLGLQLQRSSAEFTAHLSGISHEALQALKNQGAEPTYEAWIESAEASYSTLAHGAAFGTLVAEISNTLSALKVQRGKLIEYFSRQLDVPTRAEVDSLHQQLRLLRERLRE